MTDSTTAGRQLTSLLSNDLLSRLERLRLNPTRKQTNRSQGEHLTGRGGTSIEFSDYRNYVSGDDIRHVDWNIFSRLHRPYVKLYQFEEEMHVTILVDASSSMRFEEKFDRARQLAAAFGLMGMLNLEPVSVYAARTADRHPVVLPPCSGRASLHRLFAALENLEVGGDQPIDEAVESLLRVHRGRGIAVVLSDFLTFGDLERPLNRLYGAGLEVFAVQILGPSEIDPDVAGDRRFVDSETGQTLDISSAGDLLSIYQDHRLSLERALEAECRRRSGRFLAVSSREPIKQILFDRLRRRGWVR